MADILEEKQAKEMIEKIVSEFGKIDILVNNAGIVYDMPVAERNVEIFDKIVHNNLTGIYSMSKEVGKYMLQKQYGKIINISITNGVDCYFPTSINYDASKAGIILFKLFFNSY